MMTIKAGSQPRRSRSLWLALGCAAVSLTVIGCVFPAIIVANVS
jgi:hypothetical protein